MVDGAAVVEGSLAVGDGLLDADALDLFGEDVDYEVAELANVFFMVMEGEFAEFVAAVYEFVVSGVGCVVGFDYI